MLTEKPWQPQAIVRLALELFISICIGILLATSLTYLLPKLSTENQKLYRILIWIASFHGVALVLITRFLIEHELSWTDAFGFASRHGLASIALGELLIGVSIAALLVAGLNYLLPNVSMENRKFNSFLIGIGSFHGLAFILIGRLLHKNESKRDAPSAFAFSGWIMAIGLGILGVALTLSITQWLGNLSHLCWQWLADQFHSRMIEPHSQELIQHLQAPLPYPHTVIYGVATIVLAPVAEELLFRGLLYPTIKQQGHPRLAWFVASVVFALTHFNLMALLPLTFLAVILTLLYEYSGNLMAPITTHSLFNAVNFYLVLHQTRPGG